MSNSDLQEVYDEVMRGLMPFQRDTVKHIERLFKEGRDRVLVADEVGMGKTLVARGVIAATAIIRKDLENDDLFKVAYICSNVTIANQNLQKLSIDDGLVDVMDASESRLSMQHLVAFENEEETKGAGRYIQLIPLTPSTSFNVSEGTGIYKERALMYAVLVHHELFSGCAERLSEMLQGYATASWDSARDKFVGRVERAGNSYIEGVLKDLDGYYGQLRDIRDHLDKPDRDEYFSSDTAKLRQIFATISVSRLNPDLVIMDEFQRFRNLLDCDVDTESGMLVDRFLKGSSEDDEPARVLLLSATPFKPFSTLAEDEAFFGDRSEEDFLKVIEFLGNDCSPDESSLQRMRLEAFENDWHAYSKSLTELAEKHDFEIVRLPDSDVLERKNAAQDELRDYVARSERVSFDEYRDVVKDCTKGELVSAQQKDVRAYLRGIKLFKDVGAPYLFSPSDMDSCPFFFSFMGIYQAGKKFLDAVKKHPGKFRRKKESPWTGDLWVRSEQVKGYEELVSPNSRYDALREMVFQTHETANNEQDKYDDASSLLWIPASRPYYTVDEGPYQHAEGYSKTLIFSSWQMVPRSLSTLLSYEDERRSVQNVSTGGKRPYKYFAKTVEDESQDIGEDESRRPSGRLLFNTKTVNSSVILMYPSKFLAELVNWSRYGDVPALNDIQTDLESEIRARLTELAPAADRSGKADMRWYLKAMLLLDRSADGTYVDNFFAQIAEASSSPATLSSIWQVPDSVVDNVRKWREIDSLDVSELEAVPEDLCHVLANVAIGSPAVCMVRVFRRCEDFDIDGEDAPLAFFVAHAFTRKMNTPASTLAVDGALEKKLLEKSHWRRTLRYCVDGNFQAVMDEYAHVLGYGAAKDLCRKIIGPVLGNGRNPSMYTVPGRYEVHYLASLRYAAGITKTKAKPMNMRTDFACAFLEDESGSGSTRDRRGNLRKAFNSPFRPFVLVSTSIGQEGLDFHAYCRKIVHWNLPSNPIDLEQREGRINRYQSLAIRQNVARHFRLPLPSDPHVDIWADMFDAAEGAGAYSGSEDASGIVPDWGLDSYDDDLKIERHTFLRQFGKEEARYNNLVDMLVRYRAVLGQPRQEELLAALGQKLSDEELRELFVNLSPFCYEHRPES